MHTLSSANRNRFYSNLDQILKEINPRICFKTLLKSAVNENLHDQTSVKTN